MVADDLQSDPDILLEKITKAFSQGTQSPGADTCTIGKNWEPSHLYRLKAKLGKLGSAGRTTPRFDGQKGIQQTVQAPQDKIQQAPTSTNLAFENQLLPKKEWLQKEWLQKQFLVEAGIQMLAKFSPTRLSPLEGCSSLTAVQPTARQSYQSTFWSQPVRAQNAVRRERY